MTREDGLGKGCGWIFWSYAFSKSVMVVVNIKDNYLHFSLFTGHVYLYYTKLTKIAARIHDCSITTWILKTFKLVTK